MIFFGNIFWTDYYQLSQLILWDFQIFQPGIDFNNCLNSTFTLNSRILETT